MCVWDIERQKRNDKETHDRLTERERERDVSHINPVETRVK